MKKVLKYDDESFVSLENDGLVKKTVYKVKPLNGFSLFPSAKFSVDREIRALEMLKDVEGIQKFVKRDSNTIFYSEFIDGVSLPDCGSVPHSYFDELEKIVYKCVDRGVFRIGQNKSDFLVTKDERPVIVDFGNVLFENDNLAKIPGVVGLACSYNVLRVSDLRKRYAGIPQQYLYSRN
jgi:predicted Ser/Thr protein kinase